jgi:LmbE family N-acetylglucosaminyl deacetylase
VAPGWWDRVTGAGDPVARARERAEEDREALARAQREPIELGFVDGQYRDGDAPTRAIAEHIEEVAPEDALLLAPASLDRHRDHLPVRAAAIALAEKGRRVGLYADMPHATIFGWPAWVTGAPRDARLDPEALWDDAMHGTGIRLGELDPQVRALDAAEDRAKRKAIACYRTQIPALEAQFSLLSRPDVLRFEVVWALP